MKKLIVSAIMLLSLSASEVPCWPQDYSTIDTITGMAVQGNYLWMSTDSGIVRFNTTDGTKRIFKTRDGLPSDLAANCIAVDDSGIVWAGFNGSQISFFDGTVWHTVVLGDKESGNYAYDIDFDSHGNVWVADRFAIYLFDRVKATIMLQKPDHIWEAIFVDDKDHVWAGTLEGRIYEYDGSSWIYQVEPVSPDYVYRSFEITDITMDNNGILWVAQYGDGILCYDGTNWTRLTSADGLVSDRSYTLSLGADNVLWIGTGAGISRYDGAVWTSFSDEIPSQYHSVSSMAFDETGTLWMGNWLDTSNGGTCAPFSYDGHTWTRYEKTDQLAGNMVYDLYVDSDDVLWAANNGGVSRFDGASWRTYKEFDQTSDDEIQCITGTGNDIWIGKYEVGVYHLMDGGWRYHSEADGLSDKFIECMEARSDGTIWVGTRGRNQFGTNKGSLNWFDGTSWQKCYGDSVSSGVKTIAFDEQRGEVWFGTFDGLYRYDGETTRKYTKRDGLLDDSPDALYVDRNGMLWISSLFGLTRFDGSTFTTYHAEDLWAVTGKEMVQDNNGNIWAGGTNGLLRYDGSKWTKYLTDAGEDIHGVTSLAKFLDGIYIGTENGIYVFTTAPSVFPKVAAGETVSAVEEQSPAEFTVLSNYPNPFNPATTIEYSLTKTSTVRLAVYTSTGQLVRVLVNREQAPGGYTIKWDGSGMPSGVYLAELHASEQVKTVKMSLLK